MNERNKSELAYQVELITRETNARLRDLATPKGAKRAIKRELRIARRIVWTERQLKIDQVTAVYRAAKISERESRSRRNKIAHKKRNAERNIAARHNQTIRDVEQNEIYNAERGDQL